MSRRKGVRNAFNSRNAFGVTDDTNPTLREMARKGNPLMHSMFGLMEQQSKLIQDMARGRVGFRIRMCQLEDKEVEEIREL